MKRMSINEAGLASYSLLPDYSVQVDLEKAFGYSGLSPIAQNAVGFAVGHVLRNSTAGLLKDEYKAGGFSEAKEAIAARAKTLNEGKWAAVRQAGESAAGTLLAQALAKIIGSDVKTAAEQIDAAVEEAMNEKGMDPEASQDELTAEQKTERRKLIAAVHKEFAKDAQVKAVMTQISAENAAKRAAEAAKEAEGKVSAFAKQ